MASEMSFENVDVDGQTMDACLYYKLTYVIENIRKAWKIIKIKVSVCVKPGIDKLWLVF